MRRVRSSLYLAVLLCASGGAALASDTADASLVVTVEGDSIVLTVPVSQVKVVIPRGNLTRDEEPGSGATTSPRYFKFSDADKGVVISGWFESEASWQGWKKFMAGEFTGLLKSEYPPSKAPDSLTAGPWNGFSYDVDLKSGKSAHLRAETFKTGTWVDLHISVTIDGPIADARTQALALLKSVDVKKK